jgi:NTE family protein
VAPHVSYGSRTFAVISNNTELASYRIRETDLGLDFGREFGTWGEARVGVLRSTAHSHLRIGDPNVIYPGAPPDSFSHDGFFTRFAIDTLDSVDFPRHGELFRLEWDAQRVALGATQAGDQVHGDWLIARSRGRNTFMFWASGGSNLTAPVELPNYFQLGGFLNLSGVPVNALSGPHFGIARLLYLRKIGSAGEGLFELPTYLGASLEAGNVWQQRGEMSFGSARKDGSVFLGLDTLFGPLYVGAGFDEGGHSTYYLYLGRTF